MDIGLLLDAAGAAAQAAVVWIVNRPFWLLVALMGLDLVTGLLVAAKHQRLSSKIGRDGMFRKAGTLLAVAFAALAEPVGQQFVGAPPFGHAIALGFCIPEALSVIENLDALGVPLPDRFRRLLSDYRAKKVTS